MYKWDENGADRNRIYTLLPPNLVLLDCALGMTETEIGTGKWLLEGPGRRILLSTGVSKTLVYSGFTVANHERLGMLHQHIVDQGGAVTDSPSPLLQQGAFAVRDPDGNTLCFGVERPTVVVLDGME